jgi:NADH-quinone oxidoreductase chain G
MFSYWINDIYYKEEQLSNITIFQKCSQKNLDLPCFCYHENLSIAGNCRMCLVEINTSLKLVVSCAMPMQNNLKILTSNYRIRKAREGILEFLLVNHPLDCPICDQAGECDLQDITLIFGSDKSRFYEYNKRSVFDKECGPFVKMIMTRCIHCTRCVRFLSEISDNFDYGMLNRGNNSEISTFINRSLNNELSANIIDLCPVGALTSKPFAFTARPWELNSLESIDIFDSMASSIRIDYLNNKVYRILPVYDKYINEDWITNKIRFVYDSQKIQRLNYPLYKFNDVFINISWNFSFFLFFFKFLYFFFNNNIYIYYGEFVDIYSIINLKKLFDFVGLSINLVEDFFFNIDFRKNFIFDIDFNDDNIFIFVNLNLRYEMPLLNSKVNRLFKKINLFILNFFSNNVGIFSGNNILDFKNFIISKTKFNLNIFYTKFEYSIFNFNIRTLCLNIIFGLNFFRANNYILKNLVTSLFSNYLKNFKVNILNSNLTYLNFFEIGLKFFNNKFMKFNDCFIFLYNVDNEIFLNKVLNNNFIVYVGSFFDVSGKVSNLIFPITLFFEYNGLFLNFEGKLRKLFKVVNNNIFNSVDLFNLLFVYMKLKIKRTFFIFNNFLKIIKFFKKFNINWNFFIDYNKMNLSYLNKQINYYYLNFKQIEIKIFDSFIYNYYKTDVISKNSKNLNLASIDFINNLNILN